MHMENFESFPGTKYGISTTTEKIDGNDVEVEWTADSGEDKEGMEWVGKVVGKGSDGSIWEGEGKISRVNVEGKTVALNTDFLSITNKKFEKKSEE